MTAPSLPPSFLSPVPASHIDPPRSPHSLTPSPACRTVYSHIVVSLAHSPQPPQSLPPIGRRVCNGNCPLEECRFLPPFRPQLIMGTVLPRASAHSDVRTTCLWSCSRSVPSLKETLALSLSLQAARLVRPAAETSFAATCAFPPLSLGCLTPPSPFAPPRRASAQGKAPSAHRLTGEAWARLHRAGWPRARLGPCTVPRPSAVATLSASSVRRSMCMYATPASPRARRRAPCSAFSSGSSSSCYHSLASALPESARRARTLGCGLEDQHSQCRLLQRPFHLPRRKERLRNRRPRLFLRLLKGHKGVRYSLYSL